MPDLSAFAWVLLALAAVVIGLSKTAVPGAGTLAVAAFAAVLPARESTGTILLLLILADMFAITMYVRHVNWRALLRLAPAIVAGLLVGVLFLAIADDAWVKRTIGVLLLGVIAVTLVRRRMASALADGPPRRGAAAPGGRRPPPRAPSSAPGPRRRSRARARCARRRSAPPARRRAAARGRWAGPPAPRTTSGISSEEPC